MSAILLTAAPNYQEVSMLCFITGLLLIILGFYVRKTKKPDLLPGYKKLPNENTAGYASLAGLALIFAGAAVFALSIHLGAEHPDAINAMLALFFCVVMLGAAVFIYTRAEKVRRRK
ncbi:MAG: DUF3784 domain-containing protein [Lachnospiraceae bacterium]|nr:DUF3784 domain-containing protein [Lachnospiraceae bacterium]